MGISPSSFYSTFGSKAGLYKEAAREFMAQASTWFTRELASATDTRTAFHGLLTAAAREMTTTGQPAGCMISLACAHAPPALTPLSEMMARYRRTAQEAMAERIRRGIADGDVPADTHPEALAAFYSTLLRGMAVQARDGAGQDRLVEIVDVAMHAWPADRGIAAPATP
jgi:AcrR family transcriptional regulator